MKDAFIVNDTIILIRLRGFPMWLSCKGFSTHHAFLIMIGKMKLSVITKNLAAILSDLSKALDCICHNLLIARLNAYGFKENEAYL